MENRSLIGCGFYFETMTKKFRISKRIIGDYEKLVSVISEINGFIYHHKGIVKGYSTQAKQIDPKIAKKIISGSHFHYYSPYDGKFIWGDFYKANSKNLHIKLETISRSVTNYYVSMAYEEFEKFLRTITARIIINNKKEAQQLDEILGFSSYKSCKLLLQSHRDNTKIIGLLKRLNNDLQEAFKKHWELNNFIHFYNVYSKCRNHIIHSNGLVDISRFKNPEIEEAFAIDYFGIKPDKKSKKYLIDTNRTYKKVLETIVSFAYLLISSFDSTFIK